MALSEAFVDQHIEHWTNHLSSSFRAYRKHWPQCVFHHAPLDNAVRILRDGHIRSRNDPGRFSSVDVAAPGVIDNSQEAYNRVRLYFRPRTPTQFHIEGIRKLHECHYGPATHAPVLAMFVLDARKILTGGDVFFSNQNMQRNDARSGSDEDFFQTIPFHKVFHEGGTAGDSSIISHRCAEVLPSTPLSLANVLRGIWLRSDAERATLLHLLGPDRSRWEKFCQVSEELKVFDKRFSFVNDVSLSTDGVIFRINDRYDLQPIHLKILLKDRSERVVFRFENDFFATQNKRGSRWLWKKDLEAKEYLVQIWIEGHLAYECWSSLSDYLI